MAILRVVQYPDPVLLRATQPVHEIGSREKVLVADMIDTMYAENGVGLAANQVGISQSIFVASADSVRGQELVFFNPRIIKRSGAIKEFEGCLSVREAYEPVKRYRHVTLEGTNLRGEAVRMEASDLLSRIFQHETDHLSGSLFVHRLGFWKKRSVLKRLDAAHAAHRGTAKL